MELEPKIIDVGIYQNFKSFFFYFTKFFDIKSKCEMICYVEKCCKNSNELLKVDPTNEL